ncbi:MAG: LacI family DNA-binding transcriptional regulator [Deltaproteobacteria bacterium]|nr:LacI family DNA-binding transcriptional regulator [Deltaproteobacteria bacterium]
MITIKEIAKRASVSIGTVDRIIHNRGGCSEKTRQKVTKIIEETGFKPNVMASHLVKSRSYAIGIVMPFPYQNDNFWELSRTGIERGRSSFPHFDIKIKYYFYNRYADLTFFTVFEQAMGDGNDGLLIAPVLSLPAQEMLQKHKTDIPMVFFNASLPDSSIASFVGQDCFMAGMTVGRLMSILTGNEGNIALIDISPEDYHINIRAQGFEQFFAGNARIQIHRFSMPNSEDFSDFESLCTTIHDQLPDLKGMFIPNASTYRFAQAIDRIPFKNKVFIIGYDLIKENIECLKQGKIEFIINQQPIRQGIEALTILMNHIIHREVDRKELLLPIEIVARENLDSFTNIIRP